MPSAKDHSPAISCVLAIKVVAGSSRDEVAGWHGDALKVKIRAPALDGRANEALCAYLADALGLPRRAVTLARGEKSRQKLVRLAGLTADEVRAKISA